MFARCKINTSSRCVNHVYNTASETFIRHKNIWIKFDFLHFASIASILIGKHDEYKTSEGP